MSLYKKQLHKRSLKDLAKRPEDQDGWEWFYADTLEAEYVKQLSPKDLLDYLKERTEEVFIDNL